MDMSDIIFLVILVIVGIAVLLTLVSNVYTCIIFFGSKNLKSRTKLLLGNIAVSDIIFIIGFVTPFFIITPSIMRVNAIRSGVLVQSVFNYVNAITCYAQSITMTVISYDRFYMIVKPLDSNPIDKLSSKILITLIWLISALISLPFLVAYNIYSFNYSVMTMECQHQDHWLINSALFESFGFRLTIYITRFLLHYLVPIVLTAYNYVRISLCLWHVRRQHISPAQHPMLTRSRDRETRKTIKMLIAVVIVFAVFNLGFHINIFNSFTGGQCAVKASNRLTHLFYAMFVITTTINPFIYWWTCDSFRADFKRVIQSYTPFRQCIAAYRQLRGKVVVVCENSSNQTKSDVSTAEHRNHNLINSDTNEQMIATETVSVEMS